MTAPLGYEALNQLAKDLRRPSSTLAALSFDSDPFSCGTARHIAAAEWFADLWKEHMPENGGHLRRLHYKLVVLSAASPIPMLNGAAYENTTACWAALRSAGLWARYLGLIDEEVVDDKRTPSPRIFLPDDERDSGGGFFVTAPETWQATIGAPEFPSLPQVIPRSFHVQQRYHLEIWVEKSDVEDVVLPIARQYGFNYIPLLGQSGLKPCRRLVERARRSERPVRIFYVSDFDPQGETMPVAVARKIEWILAKEELDLDIQLIPLALTKQQCIDLKLPRAPIKETDRGKGKFEERHGEGATELDALEALHPGLLRRLILTEVKRYHDDTLQRRVSRTYQELIDLSTEVEKTVMPRYDDELASLRGELDGITEQLAAINEQIVEWRSRADPLYQQIAADLEAEVDQLDLIEPPEPAEGDEHPDPLFDSRRTFLEQIEVYKRHQGKPTERRVRRDKGKPMLKRRSIPAKHYTHTCQGPGCGKVFESASPVSKFCSNTCNAKACRLRAKEQQP